MLWLSMHSIGLKRKYYTCVLYHSPCTQSIQYMQDRRLESVRSKFLFFRAWSRRGVSECVWWNIIVLAHYAHNFCSVVIRAFLLALSWSLCLSRALTISLSRSLHFSLSLITLAISLPLRDEIRCELDEICEKIAILSFIHFMHFKFARLRSD